MNTFIIAEIGQAHDGSLGILHSYIDAVSDTGADAIKFQTHIARAESSLYEPFRVNFSYEDNSRFDYWERMEFSLEQWREIKQHCEEKGLIFLSSPFSNAAVDLLQEIGIQRFKIGSGEVSNFLLLEKIARTGKDIILSSGMSNYTELDEAVSFLKPFGNELSILQCSTQYPVPPENLGLNVLSEMKEKYSYPIGLSDHSGSVFPSIAAVAMGAELIEVHTVFSKKMFGPDTSSSITIESLEQLVLGVRMIEKALKNKVNKYDNSMYHSIKEIFEKSLAVNKDLPSGHIIRFDDLEAKKPFGYGISAKQYKTIVGKKLKTAKKAFEFLILKDIHE
ncbi:N-acetylneuraminate synthase family protein [uncultured Desulfobacter sp.]|uniref:N-acetylneuraminate synthase family protein n=1 Tax=uncultured Desulfobacter sp. TaxID=240139 RepID=UPI0029F5225F|nr:N-acetylneuraminate synthase family protein [uncultured Desulfobacter sp.]